MKKLLLYSLSLFVFACDSSNTNQSNEAVLQQMIDSSATAGQDMKIPEEAVGEILKQIPSPIETSVIIKKAGGPYTKEILNPSENAQAQIRLMMV